VVGVVNPIGLLAKEVREQLGERVDLAREQRLLTTIDEEVGTLTESGGTAAVVQRFSEESLEGVDLLFLCGPAVESRKALAAAPGVPAVILSPDATADDGPPMVAGVNLVPGELPGAVLLSPHPGAVLLSHLLAPLRSLGLRRATATLLQPISVFPAEALDQLFEQARSLLTFQPVVESPYWQRQLAFNVVAMETTADTILAEVEAVLGPAPAVSAQVLQAGIFHGFAASVHLDCDPDPGAAALRDAYAGRPSVRWADEEPLGPVDTAASPDVLLGHLRPETGRAGSYWLWAVMDNLTTGGAANAIALAEALLRRG
jgi:aspartate-semialdehyde dehydrogenase